MAENLDRPANLVYGVADTPPPMACLLSAIQLLTIVAPILVLPVIVMRAAGANDEAVVHIVSISLFSLGIASILQALRLRWIGSGYLIATCVATSYIPASIDAIKRGGMPLLMGMTLLGGAFEVGFAQIVRRFRAFFPAEVSGLCILLIGTSLGLLGLRTMFSADNPAGQATATTQDLALSAGTLAMMVGLNIWGRRRLRMYCAVLGVSIGYLAAIVLGEFTAHNMLVLRSAPLFALPNWQWQAPGFEVDLVIPFVAASLTNALRAMGDISTAQKINDRRWLRPDMVSIRNGLVADGVATIVAALAGGVGGNTQSSSIGLSNAVGVTSRRVGYRLGGVLLVLSACPIAAAVLVEAPPPVVGASLLFTSCFIIVSGLQVITSRLLDARRTFSIGLALVISLSRDYLPHLYDGAPTWMMSFTNSGLTLGLFSALLLNALFRIGMRNRVTMTLAMGGDTHDAIRAFLEQQGARWAARRDVVERAIFGTAQATETIMEHCAVTEPIRIEASFDEFNLDVRISYRGDPMILADRRPSDRDIRETEDGVRKLAGYLLKQNADRLSSSTDGDWSSILFHFIH